MTDELFYFAGSPFARMARVLALEWDLPVTQTELPFPPPEMLFDLTPLGQVPVLKRGEGPPLFPTAIILEHLWQKAGAPSAAFDPERDRQILATIHAMGDALAGAKYQAWSGLGAQGTNRIGFDPAERHYRRFAHVLDWVEDHVDAGRITSEVSLTSVSLACLLLWTDVRDGPEWRPRPKLAKVADSLAQRPSFQATQPNAWAKDA